MASIRKVISIDAPPEDVWDAICAVGDVHKRLAPGFVVDTKLDRDIRAVTFANGMKVREQIVDRDDALRRFVYSVIEGGPTHHNASMQVFAEVNGRSRLLWIADLLPHEAAENMDAMMEKGAAVIKQALERQAAHSV